MGPNDRVQKMPMTKMLIMLIIELLRRLQWSSSTLKATMISCREMVEVSAAMPNNKKKTAANNPPIGMLLKTLGSTT